MAGVQLSIIIAAHNASTVIDTCLSALAPQAGSVALEVIVADSSTDATPFIVRERFPWVRLLHFDEPLPVPALRGQGIAVAEGAIIAILDPHCVAAPDWAAQVVRAHGDHTHAAIGGPVDLFGAESASYATWSRYLNEYGFFMSPVRRGGSGSLPGNNLSYKRAALFDGPTPRYPVYWRTFVNAGIEGARPPMWLQPEIRVEVNKPIPFAEFLRSRYHHGRCFAGMRVRGASKGTRAVRAVSTALVPLLLMWRRTAGFWPKQKQRVRFAATVPAQVAFFLVWASGEACGYLLGAGRSCEQIYY